MCVCVENDSDDDDDDPDFSSSGGVFVHGCNERRLQTTDAGVQFVFFSLYFRSTMDKPPPIARGARLTFHTHTHTHTPMAKPETSMAVFTYFSEIFSQYSLIAGPPPPPPRVMILDGANVVYVIVIGTSSCSCSL